MNKLLLAFALLVGGAARAQITPERTYRFLVTPGRLSTGEVKYVGCPTTDVVRIYNGNHSIYKQVNITVPVNSTIDGITYLSDKLFNTNPGLEFVVNLSSQSPPYGGTRIFDENGALLLSRDTASYPRVFNTPTGTKMALDYYASGAVVGSKLYALGGTLAPLRAAPTATVEEQLADYPTAPAIQLLYALPAGQVAALVVSDGAGRQVATYQVDGAFPSLLLSTRGLAAGTYSYQVGSAAAQYFTVH